MTLTSIIMLFILCYVIFMDGYQTRKRKELQEQINKLKEKVEDKDQEPNKT